MNDILGTTFGIISTKIFVWMEYKLKFGKVVLNTISLITTLIVLGMDNFLLCKQRN